MYDAVLLMTALVIIFLGVRLVMKFREMAGWKDEDAIVGGRNNFALPPDLRELKIEEPSEDVINPLDAPDEKRSPDDNATSKNP
jgi:hypothetical protein